MPKRGQRGGYRGHPTSRGKINSQHQGPGSGGRQDEGKFEEINAHLPERFRGNARPNYPRSTSSPQSLTPVASVNLGIRAYIHAADNIKQASPKGWRSQPEFPASAEILLAGHEDVLIPANKIDGAWKSKEKYLKAHYNLLREDAVSPLRDAVELFRRNPDMMENDSRVICIYEKVHIAGFTFAPLGIAAKIRFSTNRAGKAIPWRYSRRLMAGTTVALSPAKDKFETTCMIAVVAARPIGEVEGTPAQIDIYFRGAEDIEIDPQIEWIMIEAKQGYFEAARHTLRALQKLSQESFPLADEICALSTEIKPPAYVSSRPRIDLTAAFSGSDRQHVMQNVDILESWPSAPEENLDVTQWAAMQQILTKRLAIIQGPPGTGKTHISKLALQVLVENKKEGDPPIIVAAQTNHALDQLLGHVSKFDPEYIRLGGQSNNPEIKKRALYEVRQRERLPMPQGGLLGKAIKQKDNLAHQMRDTLLPLHKDTSGPFPASVLHELGVLSRDQADSLKAGAASWVTTSDSESKNEVALWLGKALIPFKVVYKPDNFGFSEEEVDLEYEQVAELQAEMGVTDDEDIENLQGAWCTVEDNYTVAKSSRLILRTAEETLSRTTDLWRVRDNLRGPIYSLLQARAKANILAKFREQAKVYETLARDLKIGKWERDAQYLERANIVGMTTTGLSKYRPLIASVKPKIILIEEAAEVIEAPIAAACIESLEHLILIGDHQQLQGHCNVQELGVEPYNLNVSMFERLVRNNIPFKTLLRQRRMDPEFRKLLHPIYPQLQDHPGVVGRPPLPVGLGNLKSFFFTHEYPEYKDGQLSSFNDREAEFIAGFYNYLLQNSANPAGITVLTFYNGQRKRILSYLKSRPLIAYHYANVVTVDSYQGEENGIVILSLVRNNEHGDIGFLKVDNRVCVALSRAQHGFYIFGNDKLLAASSPLWSKVIGIMADEPNRIGNKFPIVCKKHGRQTFITYPGDWQSSDGGCDLKCSENLPCGHPCPLKCHLYPHDTMNCQEQCGKVLSCGHMCAKICFEKPCFCSCDQFGKSTQTPREEPSNAAPLPDDQQVAPGRGGAKDGCTNTTLVGDQHHRPSNKSEARGNNKENNVGTPPGLSESYAPIPQNTQGGFYGHVFGQTPSVALPGSASTTHLDLPTAPQSVGRPSYSSWTSPTSPGIAIGSGKDSQFSPEKPSHTVAQWTEFAAAEAKKDDSKRKALTAAEAGLEMQQRLAQGSLIELEDTNDIPGKHNSSTQGETVVETKDGRNKWPHGYRLSDDAKLGLSYTTTPSMQSSESGESSGRQILVDLLD